MKGSWQWAGGGWRWAALAALLAGGCAALADRPEFISNHTSFGEEEKLMTHKPTEPCRIYVVEKAPDGAKRVSSIVVPAELAAEARIDDRSRDYGCGLNATHAVKEAELKDKRGKLFWRLGLYRPR